MGWKSQRTRTTGHCRPSDNPSHLRRRPTTPGDPGVRTAHTKDPGGPEESSEEPEMVVCEGTMNDETRGYPSATSRGESQTWTTRKEQLDRDKDGGDL